MLNVTANFTHKYSASGIYSLLSVFSNETTHVILLCQTAVSLPPVSGLLFSPLKSRKAEKLPY
jgi:hypothetical protein